MIDKEEAVRLSKFLSLVLRHKPETIGIQLDTNGWTDVPTLIENINRTGRSIDFEMLESIVETNAKQRFAFNASRDKIRASQGHSVQVDLGYTAMVPPAILYHGTGEKSVTGILQTGLEKRNRHHVHLSADVPTAIQVGQRHGKPFVFEILSGQMHEAGHLFYRSDNGVWLTDRVPVKYLKKHQQ